MKRRGGTPETDVVAALETVAELGPGRLDEGLVARAGELRAQVGERLGRGDALTVAAVAGGTGVGKSALVNTLLGREVATEGVRRPTTSVALAAAAEQDPATTALLDWLDIPERHRVGDALPPGLVVLDLPDHDSVVEAHRRTAARLARRVDLVVWVLDPVKYARADAHEGPLADLTEHAEVLVVVLNRVDELPPGAVDGVVTDLHARLEAGGHRDVTVLTTSAATGEGVDELRRALTTVAGARSAAARRLVGDAAVLGARLEAATEELPDLSVELDVWLPHLLEAVDAHRAAVDAAHLARRDALQRSRSPLGRAVRAPLRGVVGAFRGGPVPQMAREAPSRAAVTARVESTISRELGASAATGRTHLAFDRAVVGASGAAAPALLDAVGSAGLTPPPRRWPVVMALLRAVAEVVALAGAGWLTALAVVAWLQLPPLPTPDAIGAVPWPTVLLLGGLALRVLLGVLTRLFARAGARRHGARVARRIERAVRTAADEHLLVPVRRELEAQGELRAAVAALQDATTR